MFRSTIASLVLALALMPFDRIGRTGAAQSLSTRFLLPPDIDCSIVPPLTSTKPSLSLPTTSAVSADSPPPSPYQVIGGLTIYPERPTAADLVELRVGSGGETRPEQAWRVGNSNTFYVVEGQMIPAQAIYTLGALSPGSYQFLLFRTKPGNLFCTHEIVARVIFFVRPVGDSDSGRIALLVTLTDQVAANALVERENPQAEWLFGGSVSLRLIPGLEDAYAMLVRQRLEVARVDFVPVFTIPECPPALRSTIIPGSLWVIFREGVERVGAEEILHRLPPELESIQPSPLVSPGLQENRSLMMAEVIVRVPRGWEALFLKRYLNHKEVVAGRILPQSETP